MKTQVGLQNNDIDSMETENYKQNEEILIDDADEVKDLSTKAPAIEELVPKLSLEDIGFPGFLSDVVILGECITISKSAKNDADIQKDCSILDCPSQVVPLIIKKANSFPPKLKNEADDKSGVNPPGMAPNQNPNNKNMLTISDFYSSSVGKFLIGIGLSRVKQYYHKDAINKLRKQIRKEGEAEDLVEEVKKQQEYLNACRAANSSYLFPTEKCEHCEFRTEFKSVLNNHLLYPHMTSRKEYKCNQCQFSTRDAKTITGHVNVMHEKKCLIELPPQLYECPICPYESGVKSKAATHIAKCLKFFVPEKLLVNKDDYFPTITPKPITKEDIKIYEATLQALRFAALNPQNKVPSIPGLPAGLQQQMYSIQQQQPRAGPGRPSKAPSNKVRQLTQSAFMMNPMNVKNLSPQLYQMLSNAPHGQFLQNSAAANLNNLPQNAINNLMSKHQQILKMNSNSANRAPPMNSNNSNNKHSSMIAKQQNNGNSAAANTNRNDPANQKSGNFVMCEICDGYIKDLDQLRTHMHWIHKVRIHPKMLANRPPLNCQKCQWRFFTDQGLERHLLGAHGLVTSNMQDMVNQNQDGGRCTICGRVFTNKLVTHMNQVNLKPAHLSYKCTVCSATFNLYRLFENHVYMVHSGAVKRNSNEDGVGQPPRKKAALDPMVAAANGN
ncbi:PREDICTED: MOG interacting and ectopic P-granules protein 1-like [Rhagoletis zephyria]|uniref:MOG interacting and ectopic P-granules protein 1-like n=1 Tax=Rhagoletis zephyria TaxID=28612 RepID=UPI00081168BE|nr:PREDICTED: MOG interacting and ectopic P-granules protein 1-like [Rhagoletis zephyria]